MTHSVFLVLEGTELRRQIGEAVARRGYAVQTASESEAGELAVRQPGSVVFICEDVELASAMLLVKTKPKVLLISREPDWVVSSKVRSKRLTCLERPFAWRQFEDCLARLLAA